MPAVEAAGAALVYPIPSIVPPPVTEKMHVWAKHQALGTQRYLIVRKR